MKDLPPSLNPSLVQLATNAPAYSGSSYEHADCNPYVFPTEAAHPVPCWYGSSSPSAPVVVIFGDSFVGNWIPALDLVAQRLKYRIADFEYDSCVTSFVNVIPVPAPLPITSACATWHAQLPSSVVPLHPKAIIAASGASDWGAANTSWLTGMKLAFSKLNPSGKAVEILLGTGPHLTVVAPACLSAYVSNMQHCTFKYTNSSNFQKALNRDTLAIKSVGVHLVKTYQWLCYSQACPLVVGNSDVFVDGDHLSVVYSKYLNVLLGEALKPLLKL